MKATPRQEVLDTYWRFAAERQAIFHRRLSGRRGPLTDDSILATYKFCNAYRASDRVSQFLIREVIYNDGAAPSDEDVALRTIMFRLFSKERTWTELEERVGRVSAASFDFERYAEALDDIRQGGPIYTSAFILCANNAFGEPSKHRNHLRLLARMLDDALPSKLSSAQGLEDVYQQLLAFPLIGPFMAYQLAIDLNYSMLIDFSEDDFTVPGPGAERGLRKLFIDFGGQSKQELILDLVAAQESEFARLGLKFQDLFGRRLHAIDAQNLLCEVDKYCRVAFPDLRSNRTKIKARFARNPEPLRLFYPPKWGIASGVEATTASERKFGDRMSPST